MKKLIILFLLIPTFIFSQGWEKKYNEGIGYSVIQTVDGGYVVTGADDSNMRSDLFIMKTNDEGEVIWTNIYGSNDYDIGYSVDQTSDGGFIITGNSQLNIVHDRMYLLRLNSAGDTIWTRVFENESIGRSVQQTDDGGFIIAGNDDSSWGNGNIYLVKTHENGEVEWTKTYGDENFNDDQGYSVQQTTDGGYIISGQIIKNAFSIYLIKTDGNGDSLWTKTYEHSNNLINDGYSVKQTLDGGYIIFGTTAQEFPGHEVDTYIIKTNANGDEMWTKIFSTSSSYNDMCFSGQQTTDGGYVFTGNFYNNYSYDICLVKLDELGEAQWIKTFGDSELDDCGYSVQQTSDNGFIIAGSSEIDYIGNKEVFLIKTDEYGHITSIIDLPNSNPNKKLIKTVDMLGKVIIPRENIPYIEIYDDGSTEKKLIVK